MTVKIRDVELGIWSEPGSWFESLFTLPQLIKTFEKTNGPLKRVLITSPSPTLFSFALAVGSSRQALDSNLDISEKLAWESIENGHSLKVTFPWLTSFEKWQDARFEQIDKTLFDRDGNRRILSRTVVVGTLVRKKVVNNFITEITMNIAGAEETLAIHLPKVERGEILFAKVPGGTPNGKIVQKIPDINAGTDRWKFFMSQNNPKFAFFGDGNFMKTLDGFDYYEKELCGLILGGLERIPAIDAARLDQLSDDKAVHFINAYDQISQFPKNNTDAFRSLEMMEAVVLVGNRAIDLLSQKKSIWQKLQIAILNTGEPFMQDQALQSFSTSASYFEQIDNFESLLAWNPPTGIRIWGWK
jgi:hypothetical protein